MSLMWNVVCNCPVIAHYQPSFNVSHLQRKLHLAALSGDGLKALLPAVRRIMEDHILQWTSEGRLEMFEEVSKRMPGRTWPVFIT